MSLLTVANNAVAVRHLNVSSTATERLPFKHCEVPGIWSGERMLTMPWRAPYEVVSVSRDECSFDVLQAET